MKIPARGCEASWRRSSGGASGRGTNQGSPETNALEAGLRVAIATACHPLIVQSDALCRLDLTLDQCSRSLVAPATSRNSLWGLRGRSLSGVKEPPAPCPPSCGSPRRRCSTAPRGRWRTPCGPRCSTRPSWPPNARRSRAGRRELCRPRKERSASSPCKNRAASLRLCRGRRRS